MLNVHIKVKTFLWNREGKIEFSEVPIADSSRGLSSPSSATNSTGI